jgi:AraC family transcriptional regulator
MQLFAKGEYSGKVVQVSGQGDIEASVKTYQKTSFNSALHAHDNTHISFVLHGGCAEKKKDRYERLPGKLTFYYAGEPHQVTSVAGRSRHINIEIGSRFFRNNQLGEDDLFFAMKENPDAKFLMLGIYRELLAIDKYSPVSVRMLLLDLAKKSGQDRLFGERPRWVTLLKEYLYAHWNEVITLHELAV